MNSWNNVKGILWILAGNTAYALAVTMFILPNGLITGGTTGRVACQYPQNTFHIVPAVHIFLLFFW